MPRSSAIVLTSVFALLVASPMRAYDGEDGGDMSEREAPILEFWVDAPASPAVRMLTLIELPHSVPDRSHFGRAQRVGIVGAW